MAFVEPRSRAGSTATTQAAPTYASARPLTKKSSTAALAPAKTNTQNNEQPPAAGSEKQAKKKAAVEKPINLPDPPQVIVDDHGVEWVRGRLLGSGGFARVYEASNAAGLFKAFKVVSKKHLQSRKARSKVSSRKDSPSSTPRD